MSDELIEKIAKAIAAEVSWPKHWRDYITAARAALAAIEASGTHVVVPVEMTPMMTSLADTAIGNDRSSEVVWSAALSARPKVTE